MSQLELAASTAFFRDDFVPFTEANVSIASSPVLYGLCVYSVFSANWNSETKKLYLFRLKDHYQRLVNSAKIMDFHSFVEEWPFERFEKTMLELVRRNAVEEDALIRVTVFVDELVAGTKIHGLKNSLSAYVYPMGEILPRSGTNVCVSSWMRTPDNSIPSRAKANGSYLNASLMKNEALLNGYDDAIALDEHGHVSEGTVANLFLVIQGKLVTPHTATDILEGITRNTILTLADELCLLHEQRGVDRSELYLADEMFFSGSSARVTSILSVDKRPIGDGQVGPLTQKLAEAYNAVQHGQDAKHADWLTEV